MTRMTSGRTRHRPVTVQDAAALCSLADGETGRLLLSADLRTEEMAVHFIRALNTQQWAIPRIIDNDGVAEGLCFCADIEQRNLCARLVAVFASPAAGGGHLRRYVHDLMWALPYHRVYSLVPWSLPDLRKTYENAGFLAEGVMRDHYVYGDGLEDAAVFGLLRPEFFAASKPDELGD